MIADPPVREPHGPGGGPTTKAATSDTRGDGIAVAILAAVTYVPLFLSHHGTLDADTKQYLYLDPGGLLGSAANLFNTRTAGGTVTHQNIGYLWPMGPYYWVTDRLGIPDWVAQRFWMGTIMFLAAAGAYFLFRSLWGDRRAAVVGAPRVRVVAVRARSHHRPVGAAAAVQCAAVADHRGARTPCAATRGGGRRCSHSSPPPRDRCNGSSTLFVIFGAVLWIPYAVWWERTASVRGGRHRRSCAWPASPCSPSSGGW